MPDHLSRAEMDIEWFNYPGWWIDLVKHAYPKQYLEILGSGQSQAPLTLRVNRRKISQKDALLQLEAAGIETVPLGPSGIRLKMARRVELIPGFSDGLYSVQDEAAQRAGPLLDLQAGQRVLDACAAPGGQERPYSGIGRCRTDST